MEKNTIKQTIIIGFISILGVALFISGYIWTDSVSRANPLNQSAKTEKVSQKNTVPTDKDLSQLVATANKKSAKQNLVPTVDVKDTKAPTIDAPEVIVEQDALVDIYEGVTATDDRDGDVSAKIATADMIDTSVVGTQTIHFSVTDQSGNTGSADRLFTIVAKSEPVAEAPVQPEETPAETAPVVQPATASAPIPETPAEPSYAPMTLTMNGQSIPYQNGGQGSGQSIIDSNPSGVASTWGGAAVQSGDDGQNTHFIGHNPGIFSAVFSLGAGSQIVVTDANGTPTTYTVQTLLQLDDYGNEVGTGTSYWDFTVGTGGGERITLQSCINDDINLFVIAYK
ncbi:immunoglobulin-like domain-containing protein [Enterococcus termitis]|uniref:Sortase n=1 Tax=Enterococcus termitis TaxID=332950 RepID=A0A1E5H4W0_9ENTE|nr:immunoglobulin-like domain-containing protein [Enterococcus termitis]OEG19953.1 sortase [Enterococcus termitis]OJG97740.1 hypothetical protein RV18_GL000557 [Enterococcus termitis]